MKKLVFFCLTFFSIFHSHAADLMDIYADALENDTVFKAAYSTYMSNAESLPQARAALYPQVNVTGQLNRSYENFVFNNINSTNFFQNTVYKVSTSQAIFNFNAWALIQQAKADVKASQATFNDAAQNLILRTASAYLTVLLTEDTLQFAESKRMANLRQLEQARERFNVGIDTITSFYEAQAAYDQSVAQVISAKNDRINQRENLRKLTNHVYGDFASLRNGTIPLIRPEPNNPDEWIDTGLRQNYKLLSKKYQFQAARENLKVQTSGNWPVISVQGNVEQVFNANLGVDTNFTLPSRFSNANIGLALNFPVYQGGLVQSQTRQAQFDLQTAGEFMEQVQRDVMVNSRIAFNTINDGISKVKADRKSIISATNSLESTEAQFQAGTRTMVDVVNAQRLLFQQQLTLATDQYNLINAILNLKYQAGNLNVNDLEQVNAWLKTTRVAGIQPAARRSG